MRRRFTRIGAMMCVMGILLTGCAEKKGEQPKEANGAEISYEFTGNDATKAGYAEGKITFTAPEKGNYKLYWSNDTEALDGYYEIAKLEMEEAKASQSVEFGYHTAIPVDATKIIAVSETEEKATVENAMAVYDIPSDKKLSYKSEDAYYTFSSYSDIHIDEEHWGEAPAYWWEYSEQHWADALDYATEKQVDFILSTGDQVTNAKLENLDKEWQAYQYILAQSDYVNPIYEAGGNHELRQDGAIAEEIMAYMIGRGLDGDLQNIQDKKPYYAFTEPKTGDLFIVMAVEAGYRPAKYDQFSEEQMQWVEGLLKENYGKGKNIYLVQHALMKGYGPGDDLKTPYYGGAMNPELDMAVRFRKLLEEYKDIIWISGHSHEDFALGYNYSNDNGNACNMIHNSSVSNPTHITDGEIDYAFDENLSQGYYVQVFDKTIIFNGANLVDKKIYPLYSYIIDGNTSKTGEEAVKTGKTTLDVTAGNVRSIVANAKSVLGIYYEYSPYNQYQDLKKLYYKYKESDVEAMSKEDRSAAYDELSSAISAMIKTVTNVERIKNNEPIVVEKVEDATTTETTVTRDKPVTVRLHYHRTDGDYTPWSVWMWGTGDGTDNAFTGTDDFGVFLEYKADVDVEKLGFIIRTQEWQKDFDKDQFIDLTNVTTETLDVYVESGVEGFTIK